MYSSKPQAPPSSIAELAKRAEKSGLDRSASFKISLRKATTLRQQGEQYKKEGDLENAFIYLIMAANIILEKIPTFSEYHDLTAVQKENLRAVSHSPPSDGRRTFNLTRFVERRRYTTRITVAETPAR